MASYSGLFDGTTDVDGNGPPYKQVSGHPRSDRVRTIMQENGFYGYARAFGGTVPASVKGADHNYIAATKNFHDARTSIASGEGKPGSTYNTQEVANSFGGARPIEDRTMPGNVTAGEASRVLDTRKNFAYPADLSGNGGSALSPADPATHPATAPIDIPA